MKTVLITGASRGIGLALAKEFAGHGYQVIGTYRDADTAQGLLKLSKENATVKTVTLEVTDDETFGPLQELLKKTGQVDILINNSGVIGNAEGDRAAGLADLDMDIVVGTFLINSVAPMHITRLALPFMKKNGTVVQITSQMGSISDSSGGYYDYRMSKAALNMFNQCLSKEFSSMICLALHPGWVKTDMGGSSAPLTPEDSARGLFKMITSATPKQSGGFLNIKGEALPW